MQYYKKQHNRGFSLIEVLVAIAIFATSLATLLVVVGTGIGDVNVAKNKLTANYLAQEGIELMRYKRDFLVQTAATPSDGWDTFTGSYTNGCFSNTQQCGVSALYPTLPPVTCQTGSNQCLMMTSSASGTGTGAYDFLGDTNNGGVIGWSPTIFTRYVYVTRPTNYQNPPYDAITIHSIVTWSEGTGSYQTSMSETLYSWY